TTIKSYTLILTREPSANADLSAITLSNGTLNPVFNASTLTYAVSVGHATSSVTLRPTASDTSATIKVNGIVLPSGTVSQGINLSVGANTITVLVTGQD